MRMKEMAKWIQDLRISRSQNQTQFAETLQVTQPTVSSWESGEDTPSPEACVVLGVLASGRARKRFFEMAGSNLQAMMTAVEAIQKDRNAPPLKGEIHRIQCVRWTPRGMENIDRQLPLPAELVPNPLSTFGLVIDEAAANIRIQCGDVLVYDRSRNYAKDLTPFWMQVVLANIDFSGPASIDPRKEFGGLAVGRLECKLSTGSPHALGFSQPWCAMLRVFNGSEKQEQVGDKEIFLGTWSPPLPIEALKSGKEIAAFEEKVREQALSKIRLNDVSQILGIIVAWFRSPTTKVEK